jgi:type I restriction enzyme S subunit
MTAPSTTTLRQLIMESRDGEWGQSDSFPNSVEMAVIRGTDFERVRLGSLDGVPVRYVSRHIAERKMLRSYDIVIETAGGTKGRSTGRTLLIKPSTIARSGLPLTCASFSRFVRVDPNKADPVYVFWVLQYLHSAGHMMQYNTQHTGVSRFQFTIFAESEPLMCPPLPIQRKIAAVLSACDDLIENNIRRIKILEEMAQAIYREWFVQLRFPGHEKVKVVDSSLGKIPEGWKIKKFSEAIRISPTEKIPKETKKPYVAMEGLSISSMLVSPTEIRTGSNGSKFRNRDTLFARITPCLENGKTGFVQFLPTDNDVGLGSTEFMVFRAETVSPEYVYLLARQEDFRGLAIKSMSGASGRQRVDPRCFEKYYIAQPDNIFLESFSAFVRPIFREIYVLNRKNELLRGTRDMLLPKLISGEVDVSELDINGREMNS